MTPRSTWDGAITVYRYGVPSWADLDDAGMAQLRMAHELRNELVAIEHRYETMVEQCWTLYPELPNAGLAVDAAQSEVDRLREQASEERKRDRTTIARETTKEELQGARRSLKEAKTTRREVKERLYPEAKAQLLLVRKGRDAARKMLYAEFVQERELYWATYNDVMSSHETAVQRMRDLRKQGRPSQMRFHRWDGSGTLTVQLQREAGKPARTFEMLSSGEGPWRNILRFWPESRPRSRKGGSATQKHWEMLASIGRGRSIQLPIVLDRLPEKDADVTLARITRRRIAGRSRLSVSVTARIPSPPPAVGALIGVHTGWRSTSDGDLRIAVITTDHPLEPPANLPVRRLGHGWEVRLPAAIREIIARPDNLRSQRDLTLEVMRKDLADWLDEHPQEDLTGAMVRRWRSPARFAGLSHGWRSNGAPAEGNQIARRLESWRRQDRHLWEWEANERDQVRARIKDLWSCVAAWLTDQAGMIVIDATDIRQLARVPDLDTEDPKQAKLARAQQQAAAPGELRATIRRAAQARGIPVVAVQPSGMSSVHHVCGSDLSGDRSEQIMLWCGRCGTGVDQDLNAVEQMLAVASAPMDDQ